MVIDVTGNSETPGYNMMIIHPPVLESSMLYPTSVWTKRLSSENPIAFFRGTMLHFVSTEEENMSMYLLL